MSLSSLHQRPSSLLFLTVFSIIVLFLHFEVGVAVDRNKFKRCSDSSFCERQRSFVKDTLRYSILPSSVTFDGLHWRAIIIESISDTYYDMQLSRYPDNIVRVTVDEVDPLRTRYRVTDVLLESAKEVPFGGFDASQRTLSIDEHHRVLIDYESLRLDFYVDQELSVSVNRGGLFYFEYVRDRPGGGDGSGTGGGGEEVIVVGDEDVDVAAADATGADGTGTATEPAVELKDQERSIDPVDFGQATITPEKRKRHVEVNGIDMSKAWEHSFGGSTDNARYGPQSMGLDISFVSDQIYGLPEHTTRFALKSTKGSGDSYGEPYRLFNLDVFEYETDTPMALYGAVPFVMALKPNTTTAALWLNAAETWVDVEHHDSSSSTGYLSSLLGYGSKQSHHSIDTHWMSETGIMDVFFFFGQKPSDVWSQYGRLVGTQELPPLFSIGYHQCRWNYNDEKDVADVNAQFESLDIPYDVIWLDIEHTNGKRYFTWDSKHFPTPRSMIEGISKFGRKMVTIVDPHIKRDSGYHIHTQAEGDNVYIKDNSGTDAYSGFCWPGSSSWIDFTAPHIRKWWSDRFSYSSYEHSTPDLYIWNDMNEPSVFSGPEVTMEKNAIHCGGWEHRDVHNIYGMLAHRATSEGLVSRNPDHNKRPFVLSRAFFVGSQRYGAIWTGDNTADWSHLYITQPMLLSLGVSGISFSGSDVGGFFGNPSPELLLRWYQAGVYHPFFRGHAHHDTKRREPWVHGQPWTDRIRNAIITRYSILSYLYTTFYESYQTGTPVLRPLWAEFPQDVATYTIEDSFMLGGSLLVKPVSKEGQVKTDVYLPTQPTTTTTTATTTTTKGEVQLWYDVDTYDPYVGGKTVTFDTPIEKIAVLQRGGSIIPRKNRLRRSTSQMANDPFTLVVALSSDKKASGQLYIDDGDSFDFKSGSYIYRSLSYSESSSSGGVVGVLSTSVLGDGKMYVRNKIEKVILVGVPRPPTEVVVHTKKKQSSGGNDSTESEGGSTSNRSLSFKYDPRTKVLTVKNPDVVISSTSWEIQFTY